MLNVGCWLVIGAPATGKSTLVKRLAHMTSGYHQSVGDFLRQLSTAPSEEAEEALCGFSQQDLKAHLERNDLVPTSTIIAIVKKKMEREAATHPYIIIDGFPRGGDVAEMFDEQVWEATNVFLLHKHKAEYKEIAKRRFLERRRSAGDDEAMFEKRWDECFEGITGVVEYFKGRVRIIDPAGDA